MSGNKQENLLFKIFSFLARLLGLSFVQVLAGLLGFLFYYILPIRKSVVIKNLLTAFPEKELKEIKSIARKNYQSILITFFELLYFPFSSKKEMENILTFSDGFAEDFNDLYYQGKGVIFWSGHLGSWEVGGISASLKLNHSFNVLAQKQSNNFTNEWIQKAREKHGNRTIWLGPSVRHIIVSLKKGEVIGVVGDQRGPVNSPKINFFGVPTSFYTGTATIISKTNCNVMFAVAIRKKSGKYVAYSEKLDLETLPIKSEERIIEINQRYANFLEKYIRKNPEQYFWMHKIWKY